MLPVLVVGAGPVGLLQALLLAKHDGESLIACRTSHQSTPLHNFRGVVTYPARAA